MELNTSESTSTSTTPSRTQSSTFDVLLMYCTFSLFVTRFFYSISTRFSADLFPSVRLFTPVKKHSLFLFNIPPSANAAFSFRRSLTRPPLCSASASVLPAARFFACPSGSVCLGFGFACRKVFSMPAALFCLGFGFAWPQGFQYARRFVLPRLRFCLPQGFSLARPVRSVLPVFGNAAAAPLKPLFPLLIPFIWRQKPSLYNILFTAKPLRLLAVCKPSLRNSAYYK